MRVFVAGASGVLGRATVSELCARGHSVAGLARNEDKARVIRELGAEPIVGDLFDAAFLREAVDGSEIIMHLATAIPKKRRPTAADWAMNDRVRREGTRNLIEAARGLDLSAFVLQSVAFLYGDRRGEWVREDAPVRPERLTQSAADAEAMVLAAYHEAHLPAVILRGAQFYGPEAWSTRAMINAIKRRVFPIFGSGEQYWHYIYVRDMARACVCAAEHPIPGQVFFAADDWPFHAQDFLNYLAAQLGAPPPVRMSIPLGRLLFGELAVFLTQSVRFRTDKIKKVLGWTPRYPTFREGLAEILARLGVRAH